MVGRCFCCRHCRRLRAGNSSRRRLFGSRRGALAGSLAGASNCGQANGKRAIAGTDLRARCAFLRAKAVRRLAPNSNPNPKSRTQSAAKFLSVCRRRRQLAWAQFDCQLVTGRLACSRQAAPKQSAQSFAYQTYKFHSAPTELGGRARSLLGQNRRVQLY